MTGFIEVSDPKGNPLLICVNCIESVLPDSGSGGGTMIYCADYEDETYYYAKEPYERVKNALQEFSRIVRVKA